MTNQSKIRSLKIWLLISVAIIKRNIIGIILGILAIILIIFVQVKFELFYKTNFISLGFIGTYQEHDLPEEVTRLISAPLVVKDNQGHIKGNLVSGWETNSDATVFKFKLKDGLRWSDQSAVKSGDFDFAIPNTEVTTPDDKTIQFNLKESYSPLPSLLTKPVFKKNTLIGTGPYRIMKIMKSRIFITKIELKSDDTKLPLIAVRFYPSENVAITGFNLGEVQALFGFSNSKTFSNNQKVTLRQNTDYTKIVSILFNTKDDFFSNRSLRQALAFAAPKIDGEEIADSPYPPFLWAYNPDSKKYLSNPTEAKSALKRAASTIPDEKIKQEFVLTATPNLEDIANRVSNSWKDLGLDPKIRIESGIAQNFQALLITQSIPLDPDQYSLWHATQTKTNLTKYDSKRVDKDLEDGRKIIIEEDRKAKYFDFQKSLLEDAPAVFLYFPKYNIAYLKKAENALNKVLAINPQM